jgi:hypothetical protein
MKINDKLVSLSDVFRYWMYVLGTHFISFTCSSTKSIEASALDIEQVNKIIIIYVHNQLIIIVKIINMWYNGTTIQQYILYIFRFFFFIEILGNPVGIVGILTINLFLT